MGFGSCQMDFLAGNLNFLKFWGVDGRKLASFYLFEGPGGGRREAPPQMALKRWNLGRWGGSCGGKWRN